MCSPHTSYRWRGERVKEPIKWMLSPHTAQVERREKSWSNQVYALATHKLQVERRERHRACARHTTSYRWRGERVIEPIKGCAHHTPAGGEERVIEPIKCMRSPHTSYRWRGESHRANQVYALTTHQLQVERRRES